MTTDSSSTFWQRWFTAPTRYLRSQSLFWLTLNLVIALSSQLVILQKTWGETYSIQDDARQHVFWMQRFINPDLFPNDLITDYFQSVAPVGYHTLYHGFAQLGGDPFIFNKVLPIFLMLLSVGLFFWLCLEILPVPFVAFISTLLLEQFINVEDDIVSGTPRAFVYPLLLALLLAWVRGAWRVGWAIIWLQSWFYPQAVLISSGLVLFKTGYWEGWRWHWSKYRAHYLFGLGGLLVGIVVLLPFAVQTSEFGPVISVETARTLPEFYPGGRAFFFDNNFTDFWLKNSRSGYLARIQRLPATAHAAIAFPFLLALSHGFPLIRKINKQKLAVIGYLLLVSTVLFFLAHLLIFKLHLPSRYIKYSLRIVLAIATGFSVMAILDSLLNQVARLRVAQFIRTIVAGGLVILLSVPILIYPLFLKGYPKSNIVDGEQPWLYEYLQAHPPDIVVASLDEEADVLPSFSQRAVYAAREYGIPYHWGYYQQYRQRVQALITAQYTPDLAMLQTFIRESGVDYWLISNEAFTVEYIQENNHDWLRQFEPEVSTAITNLESGQIPALKQVAEYCTVESQNNFQLIKTDCIIDLPTPYVLFGSIRPLTRNH
ncbi:MAG: hypothetical protein AAGG02_14195 [Cyanobacteria bacterium P01_H01_bin.15]